MTQRRVYLDSPPDPLVTSRRDTLLDHADDCDRAGLHRSAAIARHMADGTLVYGPPAPDDLAEDRALLEALVGPPGDVPDPLDDVRFRRADGRPLVRGRPVLIDRTVLGIRVSFLWGVAVGVALAVTALLWWRVLTHGERAAEGVRAVSRVIETDVASARVLNGQWAHSTSQRVL